MKTNQERLEANIKLKRTIARTYLALLLGSVFIGIEILFYNYGLVGLLGFNGALAVFGSFIWAVGNA